MPSKRRMRWDKEIAREKVMPETRSAKVIEPDKDFWRCWNDDPAAMRAAGYVLRKTQDGRWEVLIQTHRRDRE